MAKYQRGDLDAIKPGVRGRRFGEKRELTAEHKAGIHNQIVKELAEVE